MFKKSLEMNIIDLNNGEVEYCVIKYYEKMFYIFKKDIFKLHFYTRDEAQNVFNTLSDMFERGELNTRAIKEITNRNNGIVQYLRIQNKY